MTVRVLADGEGKVSLFWRDSEGTSVKLGPLSVEEGRRLERDLDAPLALAKYQRDANGNLEDFETSVRALYAESLDHGLRG